MHSSSMHVHAKAKGLSVHQHVPSGDSLVPRRRLHTSTQPHLSRTISPVHLHSSRQRALLRLPHASPAPQQDTQAADNKDIGTTEGQQDHSPAQPSSSSSPSPLQSRTPDGEATGDNWLDALISLPGTGGYKTRRRDLLKLLPLGGAGAVLAFVATRSKAFSYVSPQALLSALTGAAGPDPQATAGMQGGSSERVTSFRRYIADLERRGGGQEVPDFKGYGDWLNSPPLSLGRELKGKVIVADFWTYCCINCMHVLPELAAIEKKYKNNPAVVVVGVHSAKFDNEKDSAAIRDAVLRYDVSHPVVNDSRMRLWGALGVSSWPTLVIISPKGRVIASLAGEGHQQDVDDFIAASLSYYGDAGLLDNTPVPMALEREQAAVGAAPSGLRYPGKLAADLAGNRLFISDSSNHRVVITTLDGQYLDSIGGNGAGLRDGTFETAAFNRPQGVAYSAARNVIYVCDTENHALRKVDLSSRTITTLAGDGTKGSDYRGGGRGKAQTLNSPWDVTVSKDELTVWIAMAGTHQVWRHDVTSGTTSQFSGNGYERNQNGNSSLSTSWAQPSGLALAATGDAMYVADSESSTVRLLDLTTGGSQPLVGGDPLFSDNLFRFGDVDGTGSDALLQHPLAIVCGTDGLVYTADSYNHRIKVLDPATKSITTIAGSGKPGFKDGLGTSSQVSEPGGLALGPGGTLLIADTNNSRVRVLDLGSKQLITLALRDIPAPRADPLSTLSEANSDGADALPQGTVLVKSEQSLRSAADGSIKISIQLPPGYHLTEGAGSGYKATVLPSPAGGSKAVASLSSSQPPVVIVPASGLLPTVPDGGVSSLLLTCKVANSAAAVGWRVRVMVKVYFCLTGGVCLFEQVAFEVPIEAGGGGVRDVQLSRAVVARGAASLAFS